MAFWQGIWDQICDISQYTWDNWDLVAFLCIAAIAITAAIYVVNDKEVMHSAFYLALVFVAVAVMYGFLEAGFIAVVQVLVYVGAVTILFAFSIMLTRRHIVSKEDDSK